MKIGIPQEVASGERRVACTPVEVPKLIKLGYEVLVQSGAGVAAGFADSEYESSGAGIVSDAESLWAQSDIVTKIRPPMDNGELGDHEQNKVNSGKTLISLFAPAQNQEMFTRISEIGGTVIAMDAIPRISRAQKMDVLSSMANVAGYRAVIEAGQHFGRFFTGQITAAGKMPPAKVLVIGAGVAGLSATGTAVSLGAIVRAFDTRPEVREQVESMNAEFLEVEVEEDGSGSGGYAKVMSPEFIEAEMALFLEQAKEVDIIITTALIPGRPAPKLITAEMVEAMKPGSVIVDMAAEQGGNCELTVADQVNVVHGVSIIGYTDYPSRMAAQSSQLFATNVRHLLSDLTPENDGELVLDLDDEVVRGSTVVRAGEILWPPPPIQVSAKPPQPAAPAAALAVESDSPKKRALSSVIGGLVAAGLILAMGAVAPASFMAHFTVFVLACFVGWQVIWNVSPSLHTPLMSVTNAISGIIVIGALVQINAPDKLAVGLAIAAMLLASINIAGGFLVTQRMLKMFRRD
jgi:NAD(P) transhydrogenase subunit alpha